jgi:hypothetical protein
MKRFLSAALALAALSAVGCVWLLSPAAGSAMDPPERPKQILSTEEANVLIEAAVKRLKESSANDEAFKKNAKEIMTDAVFFGAMAYAVYTDNRLPWEFVQLAFGCEAIQKGLKAGDRAAVAKQADWAAGFKTWKLPDIGIKIDLTKIVAIKDYMKEVQESHDAHQKLTRLPAADWAKLKPDDVYIQTKKLAVLCKGMDAYAPAKDIDEKKTRKAWLDTNIPVIEGTFLMSAGAKSGKQSEFRTAFRKTDAACTNCHTIFREQP